MRVKLRMIGNFGEFKAGEIVNPTAQLAAAIIEAKKGVPFGAKPELEPEPPKVEAASLEPEKKQEPRQKPRTAKEK